MAVAITRLDKSATDLREGAARTQDAKAARRMLAIALVLEGWSCCARAWARARRDRRRPPLAAPAAPASARPRLAPAQLHLFLPK